jgi:hypothetical protein
LKSSGDTTLDAGGNVSLKAAKNTETTSAFGVSAEAGASKGDEGSSQSAGIEGNASYGKDVTSDTVAIDTGGKLNIKGKTVTNQEAAIKAKGGSTVTGKVINEKAEDWSLSVGAEASGTAEKETKNPKTGSKTTDDIPDKGPKATDAITKKYSKEAPELSRTEKTDAKPVSAADRKAEIAKLKEGWTKQKADTDNVLIKKQPAITAEDKPSSSGSQAKATGSSTANGKDTKSATQKPSSTKAKPRYMDDTVSSSLKKKGASAND